MQTYCKRCLAFGKDQENIHEVIKGYIESIEEERKVEEEVYQSRLANCEMCEHLMNGVCRFCGCFCVVRAIKKEQYCPSPGGSKWR